MKAKKFFPCYAPLDHCLCHCAPPTSNIFHRLCHTQHSHADYCKLGGGGSGWILVTDSLQSPLEVACNSFESSADTNLVTILIVYSTFVLLVKLSSKLSISCCHAVAKFCKVPARKKCIFIAALPWGHVYEVINVYILLHNSSNGYSACCKN